MLGIELSIQRKTREKQIETQVVEKVAMAICDAQGDPCWNEPFATAGRAISTKAARAAIEAFLAANP